MQPAEQSDAALAAPADLGPVSRLRFRGPVLDPGGDYCLFLGGSETYGSGVEHPFTELFQKHSGVISLNLGCVNAGLEALRHDPVVVARGRHAQLVVLQLVGPQFLSNRFYIVHRRRNDRFLRANAPLRALYPEIDFTEFCFVGQMLAKLRATSSARFLVLREELHYAWQQHIEQMRRMFDRPVLFLWPDYPGGGGELLTRMLLESVGAAGPALLRVAPDSAAVPEEMYRFTSGNTAARLSLAPAYHEKIAAVLAREIPLRLSQLHKLNCPAVSAEGAVLGSEELCRVAPDGRQHWACGGCPRRRPI